MKKQHVRTRRRLGIELLEPRLLLDATQDLGPLRFFTTGTDLGTSLVQMGLKPGSDNVFTPLLQFAQGVTFDTTAGTFTTKAGDVTTVGPSPKTLLSGSYTYAAADVAGAGVQVTSGAQDVTVAHVSFTPSSLRIEDPTGGSTTDSVLQMNGRLGIPAVPGLAFDIPGTNYVVEDATGSLGLGGGPYSYHGSFTFVGCSLSTATGNPLSVSYALTAGVHEFSVMGGVGLTIAESSLTATLKHGGLVVRDGQIASFEADLEGTLKVAGSALATKGLSTAYHAPSGPLGDSVSLTGSTSVTLAGQTIGVALTDAGLVIKGGHVDALNATFTGDLHVAGAKLTLDALHVGYTAAAGGNDDRLNISGGTTFTMAGHKLGLSLPAPGLLIQHDKLMSLSAAFTAGNLITIAGATLTLDGLGVAYTAASDTTPESVGISGATSITVAGHTAGINLRNRGLVVQNDQLVSLDAAFTLGNLTVAGATLKLDALEVAYTAAAGTNPESLKITGGTTFTVASQSLAINLLSTAGKNGLFIQDDKLVSLDAAFTGNLHLGGAALGLDNLMVTYVAAGGSQPEQMKLGGGTSLTVGAEKVQLTLLGDGVVFQGGSITQASARITANFTIMALSVAPDITFAYDHANDKCTLWGALTVHVGSAAMNATVLQSQPLVVHNGQWQLGSLIFAMNGRFDLFGLTVSADHLTLKYLQQQHGRTQYTIGGRMEIPDLFHAYADIGTAEQPGIIVTGGNWDIQHLTVGLSDVHFGAFALKKFQFSIVNNDFGGVDADVRLPCGLDIDGQIKFENHHIQEVGLSASNIKLPIGDTGLFLTGIGAKVDNIYAGDLTVSGNISVALGEPVTIAGRTAAIVTATGSFFVDSGQLDLTATVKVLGGYIATGTGHINLNWGMGDYRADVHLSIYDGVFDFTGGMDFNSRHVFTCWGEADVRIPDHIPLIGGKTLGSVDFAGKYDPHGDQFVAAWADFKVIGQHGLEYDFQSDKLHLIGHQEIDAINSEIHPGNPGIYASDSFTFPATATGGSFEVAWPSSLSSPPLYFRAPGWADSAKIATNSDAQTLSDPKGQSKQTYTVSRIANRSTPTSFAFVVSPADSSAPYPRMPSGDYVISVQVNGTSQIHQVDIAGHSTQPTPLVSVGESLASFNHYRITTTFQTATPDASSVSLYYDTDPWSYDGVLIATVSPLPGAGSYFGAATTSYTWDVSDLPPSPFYVYATINDGVNGTQQSAYTKTTLTPTPPLSVNLSLVDAPASDLAGWKAVVTDVSGNDIERITNRDGQQGYNLPAGTYTVTVRGRTPAYVAVPGPNQTVTEDGGLAQTVRIADPAHVTVATTFTFVKQSEISGRVIEDLNADGRRNLADPGLQGWTVYVDQNGDRHYQPDEPCGRSDRDGAYRIYLPPPDVGQTNTYVVRQVLPSQWWASESPSGGAYTVKLTQQTGQPAPSSGGHDFLNVGLVSFAGVLFVDGNQNGVQDPGEPGLGNQSVLVSQSGGGAVSSPVSDVNGAYAVTSKLAVGGSYTIAPNNLAAGTAVSYPASKLFKFGDVISAPTFFGTNFTDSSRYYDIAIGDFNADGYSDVIDLGAVSVQYGASPSTVDMNVWDQTWGSFVSAGFAILSADLNKAGTQLLAADLDRDGRSELVVTADPGNFQVWRFATKSDGTLSHTVVFTSGSLAAGKQARLALVDLNGDGFQDLLCNDGYGWINDHTGKFTRTNGIVLAMPAMIGSTFSDAVALDFDGDGNSSDLALGYLNDKGVPTVSIYLHGSATMPSYVHVQDVTLAGRTFRRLGAADFDLNGYDDLVATTSTPNGGNFDNTAFIIENNARVMGVDQSWTRTQAGQVGRVAVGDIDANGYSDVLWSAKKAVTSLLNQGRDYFTMSDAGNYNPDGNAEARWYDPLVAIVPALGMPLPGILVAWDQLVSASRALVTLTTYRSSAEVVHAYRVVLEQNGPQAGYNFGIAGAAMPLGTSIGGLIYGDVNENGVQDLREGGLPGVTVQLAVKATGNVAATTTTDQDGMYRFAGVAAGEYLVNLVGLDTTNVTPAQPYDVLTSGTKTLGGYNYGVHLPGSERAALRGTIFHDEDQNGSWSVGESGLSNVLVFLDFDGNGQLDAGEPSRRTTENGTYLFAGFRPGECTVRYVTPHGYVPSGATSAQQKVGIGETGYGADLGLIEGPPLAGFGNALTLDGTSGYLEVAPNLNNRSNWTFSTWVKPTASGRMTVYSEGNPYVTLQIELTATQQVHVAAWRSDVSGNWDHFYTPANTVQLNQWNFLAVTLANGGVRTGDLTVYVNQQSYAGTLQAESCPATTYAAIGRNVGSLHGANQPANAFGGSIDELRLWSLARSNYDLQADYRRTISGQAPGLLAYWRLDEGAGTTAWDEGGHDPGRMNGGIAWTNSTVPLDYVTVAGTPVSGTLFGAGAGGGPLTFQIASGPSHGKLTLDAATGAFTYAPGGTASDDFAFRVAAADGAASANSYPVHLHVGPTSLTLDNSTVQENLAGLPLGHLTIVDDAVDGSYAFAVSDERCEVIAGQLRLKAGRYFDYEFEPVVTLDVTATAVGNPLVSVAATFSLKVQPNPYPYHNAADPEDVDDDGTVTALDVLLVINELNEAGNRPASARTAGPNAAEPYYDVSGDNFISPMDALMVVNLLNEQSVGQQGEGETAATAARLRALPAHIFIATASLPAEATANHARGGMTAPPSWSRSGIARLRLPDTDSRTQSRNLQPSRWLSALSRVPLARTEAAEEFESADRQVESILEGLFSCGGETVADHLDRAICELFS